MNRQELEAVLADSGVFESGPLFQGLSDEPLVWQFSGMLEAGKKVDPLPVREGVSYEFAVYYRDYLIGHGDLKYHADQDKVLLSGDIE